MQLLLMLLIRKRREIPKLNRHKCTYKGIILRDVDNNLKERISQCKNKFSYEKRKMIKKKVVKGANKILLPIENCSA